MKLAPYSDLHLEMYDVGQIHWTPTIFPDDKDSTILVLAGDIWYGLKLFSWIENHDLHNKFKAIVIVLGNHDYWHHDINTFSSFAENETKQFSNVHLLHNETKIVEGIRFIGGPLWTDFDNEDALTMMKARCYMNDYLKIYSNLALITPHDILAEHYKTKAALEDVLTSYDGKTVVVTHHLPSWNFISQTYRHSSPVWMNACYATNCDKYVESENYDVWIYGHTHDPIIFKAEDSKQTVVCNPKGYSFFGERNFIPDLRIPL